MCGAWVLFTRHSRRWRAAASSPRPPPGQHIPLPVQMQHARVVTCIGDWPKSLRWRRWAKFTNRAKQARPSTPPPPCLLPRRLPGCPTLTPGAPCTHHPVLLSPPIMLRLNAGCPPLHTGSLLGGELCHCAFGCKRGQRRFGPEGLTATWL